MECYLQNLSFQIVLQMTASCCGFFRFKGLGFGVFFQLALEIIPLLYSVTSTSGFTVNVQIVKSYEILDFDAVSVTAEYFYVTIINSKLNQLFS